MVQVARKRVVTAKPAVGPQETAQWLAARGLFPSVTPWRVSITIDAKDVSSQLMLVIDRAEWGLRFCHGSGVSWIRVTAAPTVQERDDFNLLPQIPPLRSVGKLVQSLEDRFHLELRRQHASIHTNLTGADQKLLLWVIAAL